LFRKRMIVRYAGSWQTNVHTSISNRIAKRLMLAFAGGRNVMLATGEGPTPPGPGVHWIFSTAVSEQELEKFRPDLTRRPNVPAKLVYIGRLSPEKGVQFLLQGLQQYRRRSDAKPIELSIIGDGPQRKELEEKVRIAGMSDTVHFEGQLNRDELLTRLQVMDICVQPSLTEGYSKAWLDAFSAGVPVVASDVGAAASVLGENGERGWRIAPADPATLSDSLIGVLSGSTDWAPLRQRCRMYVEERTVEQWARRLGEVCARQWDMGLQDGRFRQSPRGGPSAGARLS
jgi:glycosyltransferase involved in cell wall biosynthesis